MVNLHSNHHAHAEFNDSITLLAPQWGSAVHFGGPKIRARIALSLGAVRPNTGVNSACNLHANAEFVDSITLLAPHWGSAVQFGGAKTCARIALSLGAVRPNTEVNSACNLHADDHTSVSPWVCNSLRGAIIHVLSQFYLRMNTYLDSHYNDTRKENEFTYRNGYILFKSDQ